MQFGAFSSTEFAGLTFLNERQTLTYFVAFFLIFLYLGGLVPFLLATTIGFVITFILQRFIFNTRQTLPPNGAAVIVHCVNPIGKASALHLVESIGLTIFAIVRKESDGKILQAAAHNQPRSCIVPIVIEQESTTTSFTNATQYIAQYLEQHNLTLIGLINDAGFCDQFAIEAMDDEAFQDQMNINCTAVIRFTNSFLPLLRRFKPQQSHRSSVVAGTTSTELSSSSSSSTSASTTNNNNIPSLTSSLSAHRSSSATKPTSSSAAAAATTASASSSSSSSTPTTVSNKDNKNNNNTHFSLQPKIIFISNLTTQFAMPGMGPYAAAKAALESAIEAYRIEVAQMGIQVVCVQTGLLQMESSEQSKKLHQHHFQQLSFRAEEGLPITTSALDAVQNDQQKQQQKQPSSTAATDDDTLISHLSTQATPVYQYYNKAEHRITEIYNKALPWSKTPTAVAETMDHILLSTNPLTTYNVGDDAILALFTQSWFWPNVTEAMTYFYDFYISLWKKQHSNTTASNSKTNEGDQFSKGNKAM